MIRKKYCGTAAKAGGNGENKPHPKIMGVPYLLEIINNIWPARWNHTFKLAAPQDTTLECTVQDGVLVQIKVTPAHRLKDILLPGSGPGGNIAFRQPTRMLTANGSRSLPKAGPNAVGHGVDGDHDTGAEAAMKFGWAYEVDLSTATSIRRVAVSFHPERYATSFRIIASENGKAWTGVYKNTDADGSAIDTTFAPVKARYVRLVADKPDGPNQEGYQMRVMELKVYR